MSEEPQQETIGVGKQLRRAREAMGRSHSDMAEELRLTVEQIQALEDEDFFKLPGEAYIRGYLRNYAAAVGLSPDSLIRAYEGQQAGEDVPQVEEDSPLIPEPERPLIEHPWRVASISLALLLAVGGATFWFVGDGGMPSSPGNLASNESTPEPEADPAEGGEEEPASDKTASSGGSAGKAEDASSGKGSGKEEEQTGDSSDGREEEPASNTDEALAASGQPGVPEEAMPPAGPEAPQEPAASAETASRQTDSRFRRLRTETPERPRLPKDMQVLRIHTWGKSWMQVKDAKDNLLLRRLVKADQDLRLYGKAPFRLKVGNAAGVQLYFDGKPLAPLGEPGQVVHVRVDASARTIPESEVAPPPNLGESEADKKADSGESTSDGGSDSAAGGNGGAPESPASADTSTADEPESARSQ
ncbi:RodZ domain-containing protein [Thiohalorhabdus methylotrophus]|uniref:RodZ domain-containing protein n=1 Tax=Thiohalorhabdus methylotrophus TaxID=3242694 RepID=UPI0035A0D31E